MQMRTVVRLILWATVLGMIGVTAYSVRTAMSARAAKLAVPDSVARDMAHAMGLITPTVKHLAAKFTDHAGRLLADVPASPSEIIDPPTLVVAHMADEDDTADISWEKFARHLSAATGKPVVEKPFENSPDEMGEIQDGGITIVALHAADAPFLVNNYGFQPMAVLSDETGALGKHMNIIVPRGSPITKLVDLRDRTLVCTSPNSVTGYRAAVVLLLKNEQLRPNVDYALAWSYRQKNSIYGIARPDKVKMTRPYEAAAVADDKLRSHVNKGKIAAADFKVIYTSEVVPRTTIGCFYNLKPELAEKIRQAILSFNPESAARSKGEPDSTESDTTDPGAKFRFMPIDYKKDFELVRQIDDSFDPRLNVKSKKAASATTTPSTAPAAAAD